MPMIRSRSVLGAFCGIAVSALASASGNAADSAAAKEKAETVKDETSAS